jgi:hypothetical protein
MSRVRGLSRLQRNRANLNGPQAQKGKRGRTGKDGSSTEEEMGEGEAEVSRAILCAEVPVWVTSGKSVA